MKIQTLSATLSVSDQITEAHLPAIAQAGFRAVICNRPDAEGPDQPGHQALAAAALAVMRASLQHWLTGDRSVPLPALVERAFDRLGDGLRQDPPRQGK